MSQFTKWAQTERSDVARVATLLPLGVVFLGLIPWLITVPCARLDERLRLHVFESGPGWLAVGGILAAGGLALGLWANYAQFNIGGGTPLPMMPTRRLLTRGPYAYCRNPMTLGAIVAYVGVSIAAATVVGLAAVITVGTLLVLYLKFVEEKELGQRFGQDYEVYRQQVPFIIPRLPRGQ